jgi:SAM-dependent methyltransferase
MNLTGIRGAWRSFLGAPTAFRLARRGSAIPRNVDQCLREPTVPLGSSLAPDQEVPQVRLRLDPATGSGTIGNVHQLTLVPVPGRLVLRSHGKDPYFTLPVFNTNSAHSFAIHVDITSPVRTVLQVYYATKPEPRYSSKRCLSFPLRKGRNRVTLELNEPALAGALCVDPGMTAGDYEVHQIEVRALSESGVAGQAAGALPLPPRHLIEAIGGYYLAFRDNVLGEFKTWGQLRPNERVLDVGCGYGRVAAALTQYLEAAGSYAGLDIMADCIAWCSTEITPRFPNFSFRHVDIHNKYYNPNGVTPASRFRFPYADSSFDFVTLISVFTHMLPADLARYTAEIARVTRPGGRCIISFLLLNPESRRVCLEGNSPFGYHPVDSIHAVHMPKQPEAAVFYHEEYIRTLFQKNGLSVNATWYGSWCGREARAEFAEFQDFVVATRTSR